ncbi:MAG: hypothetical protein AMJ45_03245 [Syntrophobacter sp. DG_60]|nr:MAG: hypothetical protein AMJ45_03245 [Syntrophobacter sp. DG_60]
MGIGRKLYEALRVASIAHARWEIQMSQNILRSKKRLLILGVMLLPIILVSIAFAADLPILLGGHKAYCPAFYTLFVFLISIIIGLIAGLITGCIGAGGGFIITPALMSAGIKGILAVGTDLFHIFAKAIMGTAVHRKLGNVSVGLAVAFVLGSIVGVSIGGLINRALYAISPVLSDAFISIVYAIILGFLGFYTMRDFLRLRKAGVEVSAHDGGEKEKAPSGATATTELAMKLQSVNIPPKIAFDFDLVPGGRSISAVFVAACGWVVGFVAAIMGVGGGFITFPMFIYILGVSSFTAVGTDILQIIFTAGYASISQYAIYGFIFYTLATGMLLGSLIGIQVGALTTKVVPGMYLRGFYATAIIAGFINRSFALPSKLRDLEVIKISESAVNFLDKIGIIVFFAIVGAFALWVASKFFGNLKTLKEG